VRLEQTVQCFLDFARPPAAQRSACDLRDSVAQAVELVRARSRQQGVAVEVRSPDQPILANVDRGQLQTVLVNLFLNALDAMPRGGQLDIDLTAAGTEARLAVLDTGTGIGPAFAARLFTPFASTKQTGTGLGLSISRRIIEEHGGRVTGANRPRAGRASLLSCPAKAEMMNEE